MAEPLIVIISHRLGRAEAKQRIQAGLARALASVPMITLEEEIWTSDRLIFRLRALGQSVTGTLDIAEDNVRLEVILPWLLRKFADAAQSVIKKRGGFLLEKK